MSDIVQKLRHHLAEDPLFQRAFEGAFILAKISGIPEFEEYGINTFDDYINWYETLLNWTPTENLAGNNIYYHLCLFYYVLDLPPVRIYQTPILPSSTSPWTWLSNWVIKYAVEIGANMDKQSSLTPASLQTFIDSPPYRMQDYPIPPGGWASFNDFFSREINLALRPIDGPSDPSVIVSPADSQFDGSWPVTSDATVVVKNLPWSISELLQDSAHGEQFADGYFTHSFLAPTDYHRLHSPVAGTVVETKSNMPGLCFLQVIAEPDSTGKKRMKMVRNLDAEDNVGYQFLQARGLVVLDSPTLGLVAVLPIGMAQVSSVKITVNPGDPLTKGQEIGHFLFGGSDIICVFEHSANVAFTAVVGQHYNFGNQIATASPSDMSSLLCLSSSRIPSHFAPFSPLSSRCTCTMYISSTPALVNVLLPLISSE